MSKKAKQPLPRENGDLKKAYNDFVIQTNIQRLRVSFYLVISLVPAGGFFDYFIYPENFLSFLFIRLSFCLIYLYVYYLSFTNFAKRHSIGLMIFLTEAVAIPIVIMTLLSGGHASPYYAGLNLLILGIGVLFTWTMFEAVTTCLLIFSTYIGSIFLFDKITDYKIFLNNIYFISFTIIIALVSSYVGSKLRASDFQNRYRLGVAVNKLMHKTKALIRARRSERKMELYRRLASIGEIASGVAHELNNSLNASISSVRHLQEVSENLNEVEELPEFFREAKDDIRILSNGMKRAHSVVKNLLTFSKKDDEGFKQQNIHEGIESTLEILNSHFKGRINVHREFDQNSEVYCDLNQLNQVFFNLLKNASDAIGEKKGDIWIKTKTKDDQFIISIRDNGSGMPESIQNRIFDPFFTTKGVGKGTGLGLSVSYNIVKNHHGTIECHSKPSEGTEFILKLPLSFKGETGT